VSSELFQHGMLKIAAVVLAAGHSRRMGAPKLALPWGDTTVIGQVLGVLSQSGIQDIVVVTGGAYREIRYALQGLPVRQVYNPDHEQGEMLASFRVGLAALGNDPDAALVVLGDQPQIQAQVVDKLLQAYMDTGSPLVIPSYQMRRGHPWLLARSLWAEVLAIQEPTTLRDFLNNHHDSIHYVMVDTDTILQDLDTPADYDAYRPPS
jgi:molybdenum cofactor cytidylyltransferase